MINRHILNLFVFVLAAAIFSPWSLFSYEADNSDSSRSGSGIPSKPLVQAQLNLEDILKGLNQSSGSNNQDTKNGTDEPKEKTRLERRMDLLQGLGTLLGSSGEMDYESERTIGESLALEGFYRYGLPVDNSRLQEYINLVGAAVARNSLRPGIPYNFVIVESPIQNAFSCPGGIIFLSAGLLKTIRTEAQLASILAHEVGHVGHKHALQSIQRARFFQGISKITATAMKGEKGQQFESMIGDLQTILFDRGLDQNMEYEADLAAMETSYRTGYDPKGMIEVLYELKRIESRSNKSGSWFSTHPPLEQRIERCEKSLARYGDRSNLAQLPERYINNVNMIP